MTMSTRQIVPAFRHLRRLLARPDAGTGSDAQLLQRFVSQRDESAFELLVWRHGAMVLGVCRRVLRDEHTAEDAFQAALLVLARKAASIGKRESLASWLYKVAYRVALRARDGSLRRARRERQLAPMPAVADPQATAADDLRDVLDEELNRLGEKYRSAVVLCYLEGLTNEEAARQIGCPVGTLKTRLAQARRLLGQRLARRGLAPPTEKPIEGVAPPGMLVAATVRAAPLVAAGKVSAAALSAPVAGLMEGVLRAMMVTKVKLASLTLAVGLALVGTGAASYRVLADEPAAGQRSEAESPPAKASPAEVRVKQLKKQITELTKELHRAEEAVVREKAVPPQKKPVAVIFGNVSITRDELADHLLARMTTKQLEGYVNRRILLHACEKEGITVTQDELAAYLSTYLARTNMPEGTLRTQIRGQGKTLREWKEDVLRPQLLLEKLARQRARVTEKDLRNEYEARYGKKVECRYLIWQAGQEQAARGAAALLRAGTVTFDDLARKHPQGPRTMVISRQGSKAREPLEKAAFALAPGEASGLIELTGGGERHARRGLYSQRAEASGLVEVPRAFLILACVRHLPADRTTSFEDAREGLKRDLQERRRRQDTAMLFNDLKAEARPKLLWKPLPDSERPGQ
jgi:RNA polymerase sigma factor (sigma-70 family)